VVIPLQPAPEFHFNSPYAPRFEFRGVQEVLLNRYHFLKVFVDLKVVRAFATPRNRIAAIAGVAAASLNWVPSRVLQSFIHVEPH